MFSAFLDTHPFREMIGGMPVCPFPSAKDRTAWESISPFVMTLSHGGENLYDGWMKNRRSAMISCNDGFRPVSFLIEALDEEL